MLVRGRLLVTTPRRGKEERLDSSSVVKPSLLG